MLRLEASLLHENWGVLKNSQIKTSHEVIPVHQPCLKWRPVKVYELYNFDRVEVGRLATEFFLSYSC